MENAKTWQCPACDNRYSERFSTCPECDIPLLKPATIHQESRGLNNQSIIIGGGNNGHVINKPNITINSGGEVASYERKKIRQFQSFWSVLMPWLVGEAGVSIVGAVEWLSNWTSIFSFFGANTMQATVWRWALIAAAGAYGLFALFRILDLSKLRVPHKWVRIKSLLYSSNEDGSVDLYAIFAKCPIEGCAGILHPKTPPENIEGVIFAALCSKHNIHHAFEFNDETHIGCRIKLTPKPKENSQR